jgi:hypothetical protein
VLSPAAENAAMDGDVHISEAARWLGISVGLFRRLEPEKVSRALRDVYGDRTYSEFGLTLLRSTGVGQRPSKIRTLDRVVGGEQ